MNLLQKPLKERINQIALKHSVDPKKIHEIEIAMWEFVRKCISSGEGQDPSNYENILLKYLGTFHILQNKMKFINEKIEDGSFKKYKRGDCIDDKCT